MSILGLTAAPWKLATIGAGVAVLGLTGTLVVMKAQNTQLTKVNAQLDQRINDPSAGFVARLAQANTNVATLQVQLAQQNEAYQKKALSDSERLRDTQAKLAAALADRAKIEKQVAAFLAIKPRGENLEERVIDVDSRLVEMLK